MRSKWMCLGWVGLIFFCSLAFYVFIWEACATLNSNYIPSENTLLFLNCYSCTTGFAVIFYFFKLLLLLFEQLSYAKHLFDFITSVSKLPSLLKMLPWAKNRVDEKAAYTPVNHLSTATLEDPALWMLLALQLQFGTLRIYIKMLRSGMKNYVSFYPTGLVSNPS